MPVNKSKKTTQTNNKVAVTQRHVDLLKELNDNLEKQLSLKTTIYHGLARGLATAVGATIIATIAFSILSQVVRTVEDVPLLRDIIEQTEDI